MKGYAYIQKKLAEDKKKYLDNPPPPVKEIEPSPALYILEMTETYFRTAIEVRNSWIRFFLNQEYRR